MQTLIAKYLETTSSLSRVLIVCGENGLDELCYPGLSRILTVENSQTAASHYNVDITENIFKSNETTTTFGQSVLNLEDNVKIFSGIIEGSDNQSIFYNQVCLNAGGGFVAAKVVDNIEAGCALAKELIACGQVKAKLRALGGSMPNILAEIVANKRLEIEERKKLRSISDLTINLEIADENFKKSLLGEGLKLIAEIKPSSPSAGVLQEKPDTQKIVEVYDQFADSISVLTDTKYFSGSLDLLAQVKTISLRPLLCKDFIIDEYQVIEARKFGADAVF